MTDIADAHGNVEERLARMELELDRLRAVNEIRNLMGRYQVIHTAATMYRTPQLFALDQPDVSMEVSDWGVWQGADAIKYLYEVVCREELIGTIFEHHLTTHIIEVAGDGKTARGNIWSTGMETSGTLGDKKTGTAADDEIKGYWCWGKYSADYILENGEWKIWHLKWFRTFRCDYYTSWVDDYKNIMTGTPRKVEYAGLLPPTYHFPYTPDTMRTPIPVDPRPYATWDGDKDWMYGEWIDRKGYMPPRRDAAPAPAPAAGDS